MANVKVAVRVRPLCKREEDAKAVIVVNEYQENVLGVANPKIEGAEGSSDHRDRIKHFSFDYCYFSLDKTAPNYASQQLIFNDLGSEVLDSSFDGYNVCLFAYGQTGSGKTYTMMGDETEQGVIPRLCESLLERVSSYEEDVTFKVEVSFLEIYNERVRDLLAPPNQAKYSLKVREHPKDGPYVQDLSHHLVSDYEQVLSLMHDGNLQRTTAATHMHELSSRSHAIFTITFIQAKMSHGMPSEIVSKINLVDLAGSERASINSSKDRLQEGANINKSLVTLGNCIQALGPHVELSKSLQETWFTTRQKRAADSALMAASMESLSMSEDWDALAGPRRRTNFVPYRNSILTWLLKDSLGGNSKTIMIATISPASIHYNETMSTLRYARRAKHIVNQPIVNEDRNVRLIRELRAEIDRLRMLLNSASLASSQASLIQDQNICRMLQENEQRVDQLTEAWVEKWSNAARIMQECNVGIRKESIGVIVESELPHLIGMDDDLLSTGIILYHLKEGRTKIGRENSDIHQDIVLYGPDVADEHAVIINIDGHVVLTPLRNSKCAVNGVNVHRPVELTQGAVILLGGTNMFRFNHPAEAVKLRERRASKIPGRGLRRKSVTLHVPNSGEALSAEFGKRISLSMSLDGSWSAEPESNLKKTPMRSSFSDLSSDISPIMMFNPGLELERRHKLEAEKLEDTRKQLAELEARRAEAEAARQEQETMMLRSLQDHQDRIREQKELIERLKKEHQEAIAVAQEELTLLKGKINNQKQMGKQKLEGELTQLKEVPSYQSDLCTIPSVVASVSSDLKDLSGLDVAKKRVALMELLQKQSQRKALAALERRQATLEVQERTAQLILKHEEQKLEDFETDPRLLEGEFNSEHSPEKELGERDTENTVDSSTENVSTELPTSGRVSPIGNSDPETIHNNNLHSPKKEMKRIQKQNNKDMDQKKDQTNVAKKNSRKSDARPTRKVDVGPPKTKSREVKIKKERNSQSDTSSRSLSPSITSRSSSPSKSSRSSSPSKSSRSSSPSKSSRSSSPSKSSRSSSPTKSFRSDSPPKSSRSDSPTKSSRSSSPADSTSRKSRQNSGNVFSRLYPQQDTKYDYLRKKSPPRYAEHEAHRDRHRDSPHLIRRELSPLEHDPIKLKDRKLEVQDNKHVRTSSVPSCNLPDRTKQNLHSRSRSASPGVNKPIKPVTRPKKYPTSQSSQETEKAGSRAKAKSKEPASASHGRSQREPVKDKENNKCQTKRAQPATPNGSDCSSPTKRKTTKPENTAKSKTSKGLTASPSRTRPVNGKAVDGNQSPKTKSEQTPSHRKTVKRPLSRSRSGKDGESTNSPSPRRKFARSPVVKPKNWPSMENLPKSTPKSEAFYVPLTSEQLRLELQKHASEQDNAPHLEGGDLETSGCEQHWSPSRKRSVGKRSEQVQTDPTLDREGEDFDFNMDEVTNSNNGEDDGSSSESFIDSLEEDLRHDRRTEVELEHDDGPRVVDMTSADEDEFWAIPVSSEDILTASSDEGEDDDDDDDDIALNLDVHDRKQSSDTLESVNSNDELEADDPFHTTMVRVKTPEADLVEEKCSLEKDAGNVLLGNAEIRLSHDSLDSEEFPLSPVLSDNEEARQCEDAICNVENTDYKSVALHMQTPEDMTIGPNNVEEAEHDEKKEWPTEAHVEVCKRYGDNGIPETNLIYTDETSPEIDIQDRASHSPQWTDSNATQSVADLPFDHDIAPEHSNLNVTFDLEAVELTEEEAEPCEKDRDDEISENDQVENDKEGPQTVNNIMNDNVPEGPCFDKVDSNLDLPVADLSSEPSHPNSTADKKIESLPTEVKAGKEGVPCEDPERNEPITTDQVLQNDSDDTDELLLEELHGDKILLETDLPEEQVVSEPLNLDVASDNEVFKPTDANVAACGKPEEDDIPEILLVKSEQSPEIDANDSKQNAPQEQQGRGFHSESDLSDEDQIKSFDDEIDRPLEGTENSEEGENKENPEEGALKMKMEDIEIKTDLPLESDVNENQSRTDLLEEDPISFEPLHSEVTDEKEMYVPTIEIEPGQNDENKDGPERCNIAEEDFGDASDLLSQELLSNGAPSVADLPPELRISSDPLYSDVSCEEEKEGPINKVEMGKKAEPYKVPEMTQDSSTDRNPLSEEVPINEIQSSSDIDVVTPSLVSLQPDVTCNKKTSLPTEEEIESCENDGYVDVPSRRALKTKGEDPQIDMKNESSHLSQEQQQNDEIYSMPSNPDVVCGQLTDIPVVDANSTSFTSKPDDDRKNDERIPNDEVVIVHHPKLQDLEAETHSETQSPVEFLSRDLESCPVFEHERGTSINAEQKEPDEEVTYLINPVDFTKDNRQDAVETELKSNAHGDRSNQPQIEGACTEEYLRDDTGPMEKDPTNCELTLPMPSCPVEDKGTCDTADDNVLKGLDVLDVNKCLSISDEDVSQNDASEDLETAAKEDDGVNQLQDTVPVPILTDNNTPDKSGGKQCPQDIGSIPVGGQVHSDVKDKEQVQGNVGDEDHSSEVTIPLISIQSDTDEIPTVSCTVMSNQLNQLQRPVMINLSTINQDSSDSDEISSNSVSDDQSDFSEEEEEKESLLDGEHHPSEELFPSEEGNAGFEPDLSENREQQIPVGHDNDPKDMVAEQDLVSTDADPDDDDKLKELKNKKLSSETPKKNSLPDQSLNQQLLSGANKPIGSNDGVKVMQRNNESIRDNLVKERSIPIRADDIIVTGSSDINSDKPSANQSELTMPRRKIYTNNHNFRFTRASPVPFSDEEMESMESPSSCSSTTAAEYCFDEEQTLSDFLEDGNEIEDEETAMSDDVSAFQNSEVNGEITDYSQDNGTDNTSGESETGLGIPEAVHKGTLPYIQASLPPNVYKTIFNAESPLKHNLLTNSIADSTLPDESALYQSAMDTSLYQTAVESPSAFTNKNDIIPFKNTWKKDQILAYSTPTGTPEGTPVAKSSESREQNKYGPTMNEPNGDSPVENKCRVPQQLSASPSSTMARKIPYSPEVSVKPNSMANTADACLKNENILAIDNSICIGDISTDTKSGPNFYPEIHNSKEKNGEEPRGLYHSPHDLPEQSYILHTLETIQEEDSMAEDSVSEDTCSTLHSNSPPNTRDTSPDLEHMSVAQDPGIPQNVSPTSVDNKDIATSHQVQEKFCTALPDEISQSTDQGVLNKIETNDAVGDGDNSDASTDQSQTQNTNDTKCLDKDSSNVTAIKAYEIYLPENFICNKQETSSSDVDDACMQIDDIPEEKGAESETHYLNTSLFNKRTLGHSEDVSVVEIPIECEDANGTQFPERSIGSQESAADDVQNTERKGDAVSDPNEQDTSEGLIEANPTGKRKDVFSRLYPKNVPKFEFKRKSAASTIPKGRSYGNVSPKIKRKDLRARKPDMSAAEPNEEDKNSDVEHPAREDDVADDMPQALSVLTDVCDKTSNAGNQKDDTPGTPDKIWNSDAEGGDSVPEANLMSEPEVDDSLNDRTAEEIEATNLMEAHEIDEDTTNKIATPSPDMYLDAPESEAVEKLKPFLGKDYAIASAKLTMFMRMFGLSVESTDSSEGSDSLKMHTDKGLVNRIVGEGVGYDPETFKYDAAFANALSLSPESSGNKEYVTGVEYDGDQSWMGSDVAVDGDSSIRDLRSRSTTASDAELMSGGDDAMTESASLLSLQNIDEDQMLESSLKCPTNSTGVLPETCITKSMQLANPVVDIAHALNILDVEAPKLTELSTEGDTNIKAPSGSSPVGIVEQDTLDSNVELPQVDLDDKTGPIEVCKNRDYNHNTGSPHDLKSNDVDDTPTTSYKVDESMLPAPSSVANQQVPIQVQESVITSHKVHPDIYPVGKEPYEDEKHDQEVLGSEGQVQDTVPCLTPTVPEVIHASKVQLEDDMVSSIRKLKDIFAECEDDVNVDKENGPSSENYSNDEEKELPFRYVGGNKSPTNCTCDSDNSTLLQNHLSERITVEKVQLAEMSLSTLIEKACTSDDGDERSSSPEITLKEKDHSEPQGEQPNVLDDTVINRNYKDADDLKQVQPVKMNLKKDQGMNTDDALDVYVNGKGPAVKDVMSSGFDTDLLNEDEPSHKVTAKEVSNASCGTSDDLRQLDSDTCKHDPDARLQEPFKVIALAKPIKVSVAYPSSDEPIKWHLLSTDSSSDSSQSSKVDVVMVTPAVDKATQCQAIDIFGDQANDDLDSSVFPGREYVHRSTSPREIANSMHTFKPITPSPRHIIAAGHMEPTKAEEVNVDPVKNAPNSDSITIEHKYPSKPSNSANLPSETELTLSKRSLHKETQSDPPETTPSLQVPSSKAGNAGSPDYSPLLSARSTDNELAQIFATPKQSTPLKHTFTNTSPEVAATQRSIVDASTSTHDSLDDTSNNPQSINSTAFAQTSPIVVEPKSILDAATATDDSLDHILSVPGSDIHGETHNACAQTSSPNKPAATSCVQTSPLKELDTLEECDVSHQSTATETERLTPHHIPSSSADPASTDFSADEYENIIQQPTLCDEYVSENRSIGTSPIVELVFSNDAPQAEHFSPLNIKTNTPKIASIDEQQANLSSQSNNQECQTDLSPSGPSSPASSADDASGPWRRASEVLEELSENMDSEELELFAVLMHKRRLSEQTVDRVKGLAAKLRKSNNSDGLDHLYSDMGSQDEPSHNTSYLTDTVEEISSQHGLDDALGNETGITRKSQFQDTEAYPNQNKTLQTLSPLPLSETGTGEFELRDIGREDQPSRNEEDKLQTVSAIHVDDDFLTLPGQNGSMSPPLVSAFEQSHSIADSSSPRGEVTFDRKPTPPSNTRSERPTTHSPATYSKVPGSRGIGSSSLNDWHSLGITWDEPLNRNNNSSTDYSEDDIGIGEITVDIPNEDSLKQESTGSKHPPKATLSTFSDVSFDSELDFPVDPNEGLDQKDEMKSARNHASTLSLDSDLFLDGTEPELLALQADAEDRNANSGSLQFNVRDSNDLLEKEDEGEGGDEQREGENQLNDAESFRMHMPPISPSKLEWLLAESETEPDVRYVPLSKHPEKDKIPLPGFKHQSPEGPFVITKQPSEDLMKPFEENVYPQQTDVKAYPVKFAMDQEQNGNTLPSSSHGNPSARSRHVPTSINQIPSDNNQYPGVALPSSGNRYGTLERTGSSLGESSGIYSLASEVPNQHHIKTPAGSLESLLNAASTDEEKDLRQLQSEYEQLLRGRTSSGLHPVQTPDPNNIQEANRLKGSGDASESSLPRSNGVLNGYSSGDSASSSEVEGFVHGHYSQSMDRRDISIELLEAQVMHGIGETDALLKFLDDDLPVEYWKARKNQTKSQPGKVEHANPTTDKKEITHNPSSSRNRSPVYQFRRSPSSSLKISPSGSQSGRSSPSSVTPPPPLQRVVTPLLRKSPSEKSPSPQGRFRPSEHLKFLRRVRENVIKATVDPTCPTPQIQPRPQSYTLHPVGEPVENIRTSSSFNTEKNEMELFLNELREARKMSQSEIAKAEKELHPSRRRYSADEDSVFADDTPGTQHPVAGDSRDHHRAINTEKDGHQSRFQRSDEDIIDREIASMRAAASVIHPPSATSPPGTNLCKEEGDQSAEETEGSPSKPYYYEMYDLPSKMEPLCRNSSQNRPKSQFGYSLYKDPPRSDTALTKTYPPSRSSLRNDDPQRAGKPLHQSGSIQLQQYTPLKSTGSSSHLPAPPSNRRPTPQPSGVYLSVPQHRGATRPRGVDSIQNFRGSPGSQVKISPAKSSLRNRRYHAGKPFQELPTVRESKLVWSRPECHLVAETALQTLVSEMAPFTTFDPRKSSQPEEERGWRYEGRERDILLLCKTHSATSSPINSYAGIGIIKAPARTVFNHVKNPTHRQLYDPMLKEVKLKKDFGDDLQVVYMVFKTDQCLLQHPRDCLCVIKTLEMDDRFLVVASSIKHPRMPPKKKTIRADVLLAGCSIQPLQDGDMEHCRVTHLSQVNLNGDLQPKLINALSSSLPMCIADLRNIVQIGDV